MNTTWVQPTKNEESQNLQVVCFSENLRNTKGCEHLTSRVTFTKTFLR